MRSEAEIIRHLQKEFPAGGGVHVGIGDDAAVLAGEGRSDWVVTTDLLVEGVHFLSEAVPPCAIGWKALARSLSDCAAMGAEPRYALVALAFPPHTPTKWVKEFFAGFGQLARRYRVRLAGGDLSSGARIVADVQVIGQVPRGRALLRSGARPSDRLFVSGTLGLAGLGHAILRRRVVALEDVAIRAYRVHSLPEPRLLLASALRRRGVVRSMIDISDGLSTDLNHICEASGVGARIYREKIPAVDLPAPLARRLRTSALNLALNAGEDYELLFTVSRAGARRLPRKLAGVPLTPIGEITRERRVVLVDPDGHERRLPPRGWDHFRKGG